jgi:hypothetical protein
MPTVEGEAYEFVKKYLFVPKGPIREISAFATPIGRQSVEVKYIIHVLEIPARILNVLSKGELAFYTSTLIFSAIADKQVWKNPSEGAFETTDMNTALFLADMVKRVTGGCWILVSNGTYYVWTRGYYHYVGA